MVAAAEADDPRATSTTPTVVYQEALAQQETLRSQLRVAQNEVQQVGKQARMETKASPDDAPAAPPRDDGGARAVDTFFKDRVADSGDVTLELTARDAAKAEQANLARRDRDTRDVVVQKTTWL